MPGIKIFKCSYAGCRLWTGSRVIFERHRHGKTKVSVYFVNHIKLAAYETLLTKEKILNYLLMKD